MPSRQSCKRRERADLVDPAQAARRRRARCRPCGAAPRRGRALVIEPDPDASRHASTARFLPACAPLARAGERPDARGQLLDPLGEGLDVLLSARRAAQRARDAILEHLLELVPGGGRLGGRRCRSCGPPARSGRPASPRRACASCLRGDLPSFTSASNTFAALFLRLGERAQSREPDLLRRVADRSARFASPAPARPL